jgi:hypothetical protein
MAVSGYGKEEVHMKRIGSVIWPKRQGVKRDLRRKFTWKTEKERQLLDPENWETTQIDEEEQEASCSVHPKRATMLALEVPRDLNYEYIEAM